MCMNLRVVYNKLIEVRYDANYPTGDPHIQSSIAAQYTSL